MMAQSIPPNQPARPQENAWTNGGPNIPVPHVDAESFPSLNTPLKDVSAKALQDESFGKIDNRDGSAGPGKPQRARPKRRNNPRRDIKRLNGSTDDDTQTFDEPGIAAEVPVEQALPSALDDLTLQNGHTTHDDTLPPSNGSPRGRFENVFDDTTSPRDNGYHNRRDYFKQNNNFRRNQGNRRRYNRGFDHRDDRMSGSSDPSDPNSPRSGSQEMDESRRHHDRYSRRDNRRDNRDRDRDHGRRGYRDRFRDGGRWTYRHNRDRDNNRDNRDGRDGRDHRRYHNGRNRGYENGNGNGSGNGNGMDGMDGRNGVGGPVGGMQGVSPVGGMGFGPAGFVGQFGQNPPDFQTFSPNAFPMTPNASSFNYPVMGYAAPQVFPYSQPVPTFPSSAIVPMYPNMPGGQPMVMVGNMGFPYSGVIPTDVNGGLPDVNSTELVPGSAIDSSGIDQTISNLVQQQQQPQDSLVGAVPPVDRQDEVSDMTKLSDAAAATPMGEEASGELTTEENPSSVSEQAQVLPLNFTMPNPNDPTQSVIMPPSMFGLPQLWPGGYAPMALGGLPQTGIAVTNQDPAYIDRVREQSISVAVTDTGTHFPAHQDELEIPRGPYFCVKVACVATGNRHDDRDVGQVVVVNFRCQVQCNIYVKSENPIVSYLDPLTSLGDGVWINQYGLSLAEAERIVKETVPKNAVVVGQNVFQDLTWLNMKKGEHYRASIDLRDLWHVWNSRFNNFTHYSLEHQARSILQHPHIEKHNAPLDANLTMQLFTAYMEARAQKTGNKLQDMRRILGAYPRAKSFSLQNPIYDGVCMGHRRLCRCGAPPLSAQGTPFLMSSLRTTQTTQSAGGSPVGSPTTPRTPLEIEPATTGENATPASAPAATSTVFVAPVIVEEDNVAEAIPEDVNGVGENADAE